LLQPGCKEAWEPISVFHVLRPSEVARYFPSAISECREPAGLFLDDKELDLLTDLHTETDLGEGRVPVGRQLGLLIVKPSLGSCKIVTIFVAPKPSIVMEGFLKVKQERGLPLNTWMTFAKNVDRITLHSFFPSIFMASVHPPSPHPKFPM